MTDFITPSTTPDYRPIDRIGPIAMSLAAASVLSVSVRFDAPQFGSCARCGRRIARLGDREKWHHHIRAVDGEHRAVPEA
jgi:hypothetical protein